MFGMKFGGETKSVAKVETNESLEGQIEQETVKLDVNLESLKAEIDVIGGLEELNKKIMRTESMKFDYKGMVITSSIGVLCTIGLVYGFNDVDRMDELVNQIGTGFIGTTMVGGFLASSYLGVKNWWENKKMKSLQNKAEVAGIA